MTRTAFFTTRPAVDPLAPIDLPATDTIHRSVRNIAAWGGDTARYRASLTTGMRAADLHRTPVDLPDLAAVAAWRSGVPQIREDALPRIHRCYTDNPQCAPVFAAALDIPATALPTFLNKQQTDRFGWIESLPVIAAIGGFRGVGGRFAAPPTALTVDGESLCARTGDEYWQIRADIFGATLARCAEPGAANWSSSCTLGPTATAQVFGTSYLIWLRTVPGGAS
ncbi:hypothetical protein AAFP30_11050 [Gordonia sp. CPCC 205515]|uniref:hypothetical protein n=1 Tax=Gordonia sp. CPCC 205515 TaxID=3140791 RepID=UPI003AF35508